MKALRPNDSGFTLVEVMFALLILFGGLTVLLRGAAASVESTRRAQLMTVASELARYKMFEIEEELLQEGFQESDQEDDGDFDDEGWEQIGWETKITKIDISNPEMLFSVATGIPLAGDEEGDDEGGGSMFADMLGGGDSEGGMLSVMMPAITSVLENSIRKVNLRVFWTIAGVESEVFVDCYFTNPSAVRL